MKIKTPVGYLLVDIKGTEHDYPGVVVKLSPDGFEDGARPLAVVDFDSETQEINAYLYADANSDEPTNVEVLLPFVSNCGPETAAEKLALDIVDFFHDVDTYDYEDTFGDYEDVQEHQVALATTVKNLESTEGKVSVIKKILGYLDEEDNPEVNRDMFVSIIDRIIGMDIQGNAACCDDSDVFVRSNIRNEHCDTIKVELLNFFWTKVRDLYRGVKIPVNVIRLQIHLGMQSVAVAIFETDDLVPEFNVIHTADPNVIKEDSLSKYTFLQIIDFFEQLINKIYI